MRIAVTGSSGLIGTALVSALRAEGHQVQRLVRRAASAPDEVSWDPGAGTVDLDGLAGTDAVVHLAGVGVGDSRWTPSYQQLILSSRVEGTTTIATAMTRLDPKPKVLLSASAIGWYGDTGAQALDESAPAGRTFLADVVRQWEAATEHAEAAGIRVAHLRTGLVLSPDGGALGRLLPLAKLGLAGPLGSGRQYWSWITLHDEVRAITHLLTSERSGPVNLTAPTPVTNAELTSTLGDLLHRPTVLPVPGFALRLVLGGFASEILTSQRVVPAALLADDFAFDQPDVRSGLASVLGRSIDPNP